MKEPITKVVKYPLNERLTSNSKSVFVVDRTLPALLWRNPTNNQKERDNVQITVQCRKSDRHKHLGLL